MKKNEVKKGEKRENPIVEDKQNMLKWWKIVKTEKTSFKHWCVKVFFLLAFKKLSSFVCLHFVIIFLACRFNVKKAEEKFRRVRKLKIRGIQGKILHVCI